MIAGELWVKGAFVLERLSILEANAGEMNRDDDEPTRCP
jgi:hypothetical protein